ncbi:B-type lectin plumieribetin-like [Diretmus argenteus]
MSKNYLSKNDELRKGDYLMSNNREWKAVFQEDGNFVIYGWKPMWSTDTANSDAFRLCMQEDCNLVMYNKAGKPMWHTNSCKDSKCNMCRVHLADDGTLYVQREGDDIWNSSSSKGMK